MGVECLNQLGEVGERSGQPIDLIDDDDVDPSGLHIDEQFLQGRPIHRAAGKAAIVKTVPDQPPPSPPCGKSSNSPLRAIALVSAAPRLCSLLVVTRRPVSTSPQVAALTNSDGLFPTWARQSPGESLSRMSASRVVASGMRSRASARHISATPSWLESEYSWMSPSTPLNRVLGLRRVTRVRANTDPFARGDHGRLSPPGA